MQTAAEIFQPQKTGRLVKLDVGEPPWLPQRPMGTIKHAVSTTNTKKLEKHTPKLQIVEGGDETQEQHDSSNPIC